MIRAKRAASADSEEPALAIRGEEWISAVMVVCDTPVRPGLGGRTVSAFLGVSGNGGRGFDGGDQLLQCPSRVFPAGGAFGQVSLFAPGDRF